jgi:hypothetical protein
VQQLLLPTFHPSCLLVEVSDCLLKIINAMLNFQKIDPVPREFSWRAPMLPFFLAIAFRVFSRLFGIVAVGLRQNVAVGCVVQNTILCLSYRGTSFKRSDKVRCHAPRLIVGTPISLATRTRLGHDKGDAPRGRERPFRVTTGAYSEQGTTETICSQHWRCSAISYPKSRLPATSKSSSMR